MPVRLLPGDPVLVCLSKKEKTHAIGVIKYIGYIQGYDMTEYVGIELLEECQNGHDGTINGFPYFTAKQRHGIHVRIANIIRKLNGTEIMIKMQEVITMFKQKLDQYVGAVDQRDEYIEKLKQTHRDAKRLLKHANDKISTLKLELSELKRKYKESNHAKNLSKNNKNNHLKTSNHINHSKSCGSNHNLANIAKIIEIESVGDEVGSDIDHLIGNKHHRSNSFRHSRNLSAQLTLETIDDFEALTTPVADVPLLIDQLVQSMDGRRQSFNTVRSPITPMTPVTPSIDEASNLTSVDEQSENVYGNIIKNKKKLYKSSFPDTEMPSKSSKNRTKMHGRLLSESNITVTSNMETPTGCTTSKDSPISPNSVEISPSPSPNLQPYKRTFNGHRKTTSNLTEMTATTVATPDTTEDTRYDTDYVDEETEIEEEETDRGDHSTDDDLDTQQLDDGNNTPYWSSSNNSEVDLSQNTRHSYTYTSTEDNTATNNADSPYDVTPKPNSPSTPRHHKKRRKRKQKKKSKNSHQKRSSVESPPHTEQARNNKSDRRRSSKKNRRRSSKKDRKYTKKPTVAPNTNTNTLPLSNATSAQNHTNPYPPHTTNGQQQHIFPFPSRSQPPSNGPHHHHQGSMPIMHSTLINNNNHPQQPQPQSINQPPPQHTNNKAQRRPNQQSVQYYMVAVPQLDNWLQQQQPAQVQPQAQTALNQASGGNVAMIPVQQIENNPYLDQKYLPKFQNYSEFGQPLQRQMQPQQAQQAQAHHYQAPVQQIKYNHRAYYSDNIVQQQPPSLQPHQQQQQQRKGKQVKTKSHKVQVAKRGRRSYQLGHDKKNIQMFNVSRGGQNTNNNGNIGYISNYICDEL